ncbi:hypothetical protein VWY34_05345 [Phaeobacter sp. JH20_02]|uniref:hypothetical protein n=1 Tax=unclassified Phaeobacter TaxID=2621772 RepID=UPI003A86F906
MKAARQGGSTAAFQDILQLQHLLHDAPANDRSGLPGVVWEKRLGEVSLQPYRRIAASR